MKKIFTLLAGGLLGISLVNAQLDTTGLYTWQPMYNSMSTWDEGAFNMNKRAILTMAGEFIIPRTIILMATHCS